MEAFLPELPEVEVLVRHLRPHLVGRRIESISIRRDRLVADRSPRSFAARLRGRAVHEVRRRAKVLWLTLDDGSHWIVHQKMTGRLTWFRRRPPVEPPHTLAAFRLDAGWLLFSDLRRFGRMWWLAPSELDRHFARFGPEPLSKEWTSARWQRDLAGRRSSIKQVLLDPSILAGVGNIYASEALFLARVDPRTCAGALSPCEAVELRRCVRRVLRRAIALGSTVQAGGDAVSPKYYHAGDPEPSVHDELRVYDRRGLPCLRCGSPIERIRQGQRSTFFCPRCQGKG